MLKYFQSIYFHQRFFIAFFSLAVLFLFSYWYQPLYKFVWMMAVLLMFLTILDIIILYTSVKISAERILPEKMSNSDHNPVQLHIKNANSFRLFSEIIDEIPIQFQKRDFLKKMILLPQSYQQTEYSLRPVKRGEYTFGKLNIFISTYLRLIKRRFIFGEYQMVKVYPSFIQMRQYDFLAIDNRLRQTGIKKIRRIGHTQEFEQIKEYVRGDDIRSMNWKATAKHRRLMVNQFQDEKAQPLFSIIDTGRVMKMPFNGMSLLDYSINSSLAFSNVAIQKKDKVGLISFSNEIGKMMQPSAKKTHLHLIMENLYNIKTEFLDSDFGLLNGYAKKQIKQRSLLIIYTNFEHMNGLDRKMPYFKALAKKHIVLVIFFENTELEKVTSANPERLPDIAHQVVAEGFQNEKRLMARKLQQNGIQTVLTSPENLTVNTINKYLEIKSRGIL